MRTLACLAAAALFVACSSSDEAGPAASPPPGAGPVIPAPPPAAAGPDAGEASPLYLLNTVVSTPESGSSYYTLVSSLDPSTVVDYANSLELPAYPALFGRRDLGWFGIGGGESPVVQRLVLEERGMVPTGPVLSFASYGITYMQDDFFQVVSPTKAYYFDAGQALIVVWNPEAMTVERTIPIDVPVRPGGELQLSKIASRPGQLVFTAGWRAADYSGAFEGVELLVLDIANDALTHSPHAGCSAMWASATSANGDLYFFSNNVRMLGLAGAGTAPDDCVLRVRPGERAFDPGYRGSMAAALGGRHASATIQRDGSSVWALALDESIFAPAPGVTYGEFHGAKAWRRYRVRFPELDVAVEEESRTTTAYNGNVSLVEDRVYWSEGNADFSESRLLDATGERLLPSISFRGSFAGMLRVR